MLSGQSIGPTDKWLWIASLQKNRRPGNIEGNREILQRYD